MEQSRNNFPIAIVAEERELSGCICSLVVPPDGSRRSAKSMVCADL